jgi:hypothetical protein
MTVTFAEIVPAPEQPYAETFLYNAAAKPSTWASLSWSNPATASPSLSPPATTAAGRRSSSSPKPRRKPPRIPALKTYWLSGVLGNSQPVWIADPRDAQYLNTTEAELLKWPPTRQAKACSPSPANTPQPPRSSSPAPRNSAPYKVLKIQLVGGDGGFDYVTADPDGRNLYVARSGPAGHIGVFNLDTLQPRSATSPEPAPTAAQSTPHRPRIRHLQARHHVRRQNLRHPQEDRCPGQSRRLSQRPLQSPLLHPQPLRAQHHRSRRQGRRHPRHHRHRRRARAGRHRRPRQNLRRH